MKRGLLFLVPVALLVCGCGKKEPPPAAAPAPAAPVTAVPVSSPAQPPAAPSPAPPPAAPEPAIDEFEQTVAGILALEQDAEFVEALQVGRQARSAFSDHPEVSRLDEILQRLKEERRESLDLPFAIRNLGADSEVDVQIAREAVIAAAATGRIFLRKAVRTGSDAVAARAAMILGDLVDTDAIPDIVGRFGRAVPSPLGQALGQVLSGMAEAIGPEDLENALALVRGDKGFGRRRLVGALVTVLDDLCGENAETFNGRMGDQKAFEDLRDYVEAALVSEDPEIVGCACETGGSLVGTMAGLRADYYLDPDFREFAMRSRVDYPYKYHTTPSPLPDGRLKGYGARWTGFVDVPADGEYVFSFYAETKGTVWIGTEEVVSSWDWGERHGTNRLAAGLHPIRIDLYSQPYSSYARIELRWSGPGIQKTMWVPYRTRPWLEAVTNISQSIGNLVSTNLETARIAGIHVRDGDESARILLRAALDDESMAVRKKALNLLVLDRDERTAKLLLDRAAAETDPVWIQEIAGALHSLAGLVSTNQVPLLLDTVKAEAKPTMHPHACALFGILQRVCQGDAATFNEMAGDPSAHETLSGYWERAAVSTNQAAAARSAEFGAPFAPYLAGARAEYFLGEAFQEHAFDRTASSLYESNRDFPYPDNRQDYISVRWTGLLDVNTAGDYTFRMYAEDWAQLWIGHRPVVYSTAWTLVTNSVSLDAGVHPLRLDLGNRTSNTRLDLRWSGPGVEDQVLSREHLRTPVWRSETDRMAAALDNLASTNIAVASSARARLQVNDPVSRIFLRNAFRYASDEVADEAVRLLEELGDEGVIPVLFDRLERDPDSSLSPAIARALTSLVWKIPRERFGEMLEQVRSDKASGMIPQAAALCAALRDRCAGDEKAFAELAGDAKAVADLRQYVERALASPDGDVVARACMQGAPFAPVLPGIKARYYGSPNHAGLLQERIDSTPYVENRAPRLHGGQVDRISAVWEGYLRVEQAGTYTFFGRADDLAQVWVDGTLVVDNGNTAANAYVEASGAVALVPGLHPLRVVFAQYRSGYNMRLAVSWEGPDIARQQIPFSHLTTLPNGPTLRALADAVPDLASTNAAVSAAARAGFLDRDELGAVFLRNALRHEPDAIAKPATELLVAMHDREAVGLLEMRLLQKDSELFAPLAAEALSAIPDALSPEQVAALYARFVSRPDRKMDFSAAALCAVLEKVCGGDAAKFGERAGNAKAHEALRTHILSSLESSDPAEVAWACQYGGPFVPPVQGLRGRFYKGRAFDNLALDTYVSSVNMGNRQLISALGIYDDISIRWDGRVNVKQPGEYVFYVTADDGSRVWVDGKPVVDGWLHKAGTEVQGTVALSAGFHPVAVSYYQRESSSGITLSWSGPGVAKTLLSGDVLQTPAIAVRVAQVQSVVSNLASAVKAEADAAKQGIGDAGEIGLVCLRNAVRHGEETVAAFAGAMLVQTNDLPAVPLLGARLAKGLSPGPARVFVEGLKLVPKDIPQEQLPSLYALLQKDEKNEMKELVELMDVVLQERCTGDVKKLAALVGDPGAEATITEYVDTAFVSTNSPLSAWAAAYKGHFGSYTNGLRGEYFEGTNFGTRVEERLDAALSVKPGAYPVSEAFQTNMCARWTGYVVVENKGSYTFYVSGAGRGLWVNGKAVSPGSAVAYEPGAHAFKAECVETGTAKGFQVEWNGPGVNRQVLGGALVRAKKKK